MQGARQIRASLARTAAGRWEPGSVDHVGPAQLEWRANATFLVTGSIQVEVTAVDHGWSVQALSMTRTDHWGLLILDGPFVPAVPRWKLRRRRYRQART